MKKIIVEGTICSVFVLAGLVLIISRITSIADKASATPFLLGLFLLFVGLLIFLVTLRSIMKYLAERNRHETAAETVVIASNKLIDRNNDIVNDWDKTNEARDRLKLLKMASASGEE